jgi:hypothetical protein
MEVGNSLAICTLSPPLWQWWDNAHQHMVVLVEFSKDIMTLQIFSLPDEDLNDDTSSSATSATSSCTRSGALVAGDLLLIPLTTSLLHNAKGELIIPFLVKFSLDLKMIVIKFSSTLIRIVPVVPTKNSTGTSNTNKHWTIDLGIDTTPTTTGASSLISKGVRRNLTRTASELVLKEGLYWSDNCGVKSSSRELIVVTTRAVHCYKISSLERHQQIFLTHSLQTTSTNCNDRVWWEPKTHSLVVGANKSMRQYLFGSSQVLTSVSSSAARSSRFPHRKFPPSDKVPAFSLQGDGKRVFLVNIYGEACLVQFREKVIDFYTFGQQSAESHLKMVALREPFPLEPDDELFLSVVDNVLCFIIRQRPEYVLLVDKGGFNLFVPNASSSMKSIYLKPCHVLYSKESGQQHFASLVMDLDTISRYYSDKSSMVSFLLERRAERSTEAQPLVLTELSKLLDQQVTSRRRPSTEDGGMSRFEWIEKVVDAYQQSTTEAEVGRLCSTALMSRCALLPPETELQYTEGRKDPARDANNEVQSRSVTQSMILEVLVAQAHKGLDNGNKIKLRLVCDTAIEIMVALTQRSLQPCQALYCLIIALLWRLNHTQELIAVMRSIVEEHTSLESKGYDTLAELVLLIATNVRLGCKTLDTATEINNTKNEVVFNKVMISVSAISSPSLRVKQLLRRGRVTKAVQLCSKLEYHLNKTGGSFKRRASNLDSVRSKIGVGGDAFFQAAIAQASSHDMSIGERCRLFCYVHHFLLTWYPECLQDEQQLSLDGTIDCVGQGVSVESTFPDFPDHLFGGENTLACRKVRGLFGYSEGALSLLNMPSNRSSNSRN